MSRRHTGEVADRTDESLYPVCGAKTRKGRTCGRPAGWGTNHIGIGSCKLHGGSTKNHQKAALRTMLLAEMEAGTNFGVDSPVDIHPMDALLQLVKMTAGYVRWLSMRVSQLEGVGQTTKAMGMAAKVEIQLLSEYTDRLARFSKMALDAGVEERMVTLAERQGEMVAQMLVNFVEDLGLSASQKKQVPELVRKHLMAIEAFDTGGVEVSD